jgi:hypothetical protein
MSALNKLLSISIQGGCLSIFFMIKQFIKGGSYAFLFIVLVLITAFNSTTQASPAGGNIVGGSGNINQTGSITTIQQNTQSLAIDWKSFNVSKNETVNFLQPGASAIALNHILGNNASQIHGQINTNARLCWLTQMAIPYLVFTLLPEASSDVMVGRHCR